MATIKQASKRVIDHPYFSHCLEMAKNGDMSGFDRLLYEVMSSVWERSALDASRVYGRWHRLNHCDIKKELRDMPPPNQLDIHLPIPPPERLDLQLPIPEPKLKFA